MRALDYIIRTRKSQKISKRLTALMYKSIEKMIFFKYIQCEFDSELLDLIELSDLINGVAT